MIKQIDQNKKDHLFIHPLGVDPKCINLFKQSGISSGGIVRLFFRRMYNGGPAPYKLQHAIAVMCGISDSMSRSKYCRKLFGTITFFLNVVSIIVSSQVKIRNGGVLCSNSPNLSKKLLICSGVQIKNRLLSIIRGYCVFAFIKSKIW